MIDIRYVPGKSITIKGHAGYAEKGKDIVCAAISTLYCTMILHDGIAGTQDEEGMQALLLNANAEDVFCTFAIGMRKVAEQYPQYCRFKRGRIELEQY